MSREIKLLLGSVVVALILFAANAYVDSVKLLPWTQSNGANSSAAAGDLISAPNNLNGVCDSNDNVIFKWYPPTLGWTGGIQYFGAVTDTTLHQTQTILSTITSYSFIGQAGHTYSISITPQSVANNRNVGTLATATANKCPTPASTTNASSSPTSTTLVAQIYGKIYGGWLPTGMIAGPACYEADLYSNGMTIGGTPPGSSGYGNLALCNQTNAPAPNSLNIKDGNFVFNLLYPNGKTVSVSGVGDHIVDPAYTSLTVAPIAVSKGKLQPVSGVQVTVSDSNSAKLTWPAVSGATSYVIYVDGVLWDSANSTSYSFGPILMPGTDYAVTVEALIGTVVPPGTLAITSAEPSKPSFFASIWNYVLAAVGAIQPMIPDPTPPTVIHGSAELPVPKTATVAAPVNVLAILLEYPGPIDAITLDSTSTVNKKLFDVTKNGNSVKNYYKETSYGKFNISGNVVDIGVPQPSVNVTATTTFESIMGSNISNGTDLMYLAANKQAVKKLPADKKFTDYKIIIYVWPRLPTADPQKYISGKADIGLAGGEVNGRIWINGPAEQQIYSHEIGHVLGLYHADAIVCKRLPSMPSSLPPVFFDWDNGCTIYAGADPINLMGRENYGQIDPYRKFILGWVSSSPIISSGRYAIIPDENSSAKAFYVAQTLEKVDFPRQYSFYLDYRRPIGFDFDLKEETEGVNIEISPGAYTTPKDTSYLKIGDSATSSIPFVVRDGGIFYTPLVYKDFSPVSGVKIIQLSHDDNAANIYVRFDAVPIVTTTASSTSIKVNWTWPDSVIPTGGYEIYRDATSTSSLIGTTSPSTLTFTDKGLDPGSTYAYYVRGVDTFKELPLDQKLPRTKYPMPFSTPKTAKTTSA